MPIITHEFDWQYFKETSKKLTSAVAFWSGFTVVETFFGSVLAVFDKGTGVVCLAQSLLVDGDDVLLNRLGDELDRIHSVARRRRLVLVDAFCAGESYFLNHAEPHFDREQNENSRPVEACR